MKREFGCIQEDLDTYKGETLGRTLSIVRRCSKLPKEIQVIKKKVQVVVFLGDLEAEK